MQEFKRVVRILNLAPLKENQLNVSRFKIRYCKNKQELVGITGISQRMRYANDIYAMIINCIDLADRIARHIAFALPSYIAGH